MSCNAGVIVRRVETPDQTWLKTPERCAWLETEYTPHAHRCGQSHAPRTPQTHRPIQRRLRPRIAARLAVACNGGDLRGRRGVAPIQAKASVASLRSETRRDRPDGRPQPEREHQS